MDLIEKPKIVGEAVLLMIAFLITAAVAVFKEQKVNQVNALITNCEKELPRNKHCKLVAVIDEQGER